MAQGLSHRALASLCVQVLISVAEAVSYLHSLHLIHCDIKVGATLPQIAVATFLQSCCRRLLPCVPVAQHSTVRTRLV
jgi:serine/threonine protein kinase